MVVEGPVASVVAGFVVSLGLMNFIVTYVIVIVGDLVGDVIYYILGRWGRRGFVEKWGHYIGIHETHVENIERFFIEKGGRTLILGKLSHGVGGMFLFAAGAANMHFGKFVWYNFVATIIKSLALILIGFYFGTAISKINSIMEFIAYLTAGVFIVMVFIGFFLYAHRKGLNKI